MLSADRSHRLLSLLNQAIQHCKEEEKKLEEEVRQYRDLLKSWKTDGYEDAEEDDKPGEVPGLSTGPSAEEIQEVAMLNKALEKAMKVRTGSRPQTAVARPPASEPPCPFTKKLAKPSISSSRAGKRPVTYRLNPPYKTNPEKKLGRSSNSVAKQKTPVSSQPAEKDRCKGPQEVPGDYKSGNKETGTSVHPPSSPKETQDMREQQHCTLKDIGRSLKLSAEYRRVYVQNHRLWQKFSDLQKQPPSPHPPFIERLQSTFDPGCPRMSLYELREELARLDGSITRIRMNVDSIKEWKGTGPRDWQAHRLLLDYEALLEEVNNCVSVLEPLKQAMHCRCSKCSTSRKRRVRPRPRRLLTLLCLPDDVLLYILQYLSAEDILSVRDVHPQLMFLVDNHSSVWARASFQDAWPSHDSQRLFEWAASCGNFEACVKLGIAYLYNEGLSMSDESRAEVNGLNASRFFSLTEHMNTGADPFIWLFIRPPWSSTGSCCKAVVFDSLKEECAAVTPDKGVKKGRKGSIQYCLAKVLSLFEDEEKKKEALQMLEASAADGCLHSSYLLWEVSHKTSSSDPGRYLQSLRQLKDYAARGCWDAQMALAKTCAHRNQLGQDRTSSELVSQVFQSSQPINKSSIFTRQKGMNDTMRYILIDWLVEVATMKDFSSLCLHTTVGLVDRYLKLRCVPRARLQLVGIACMVICTRFISKEILTIREAVWLTDNTYKYEDLVRMMGEIISALDGKIKMPTVVDYKDVLLHIVPLDQSTLHLLSYICELSLLYTELSVYSPAHLAASAFLLVRILHKQAIPWNADLIENTGFTLEHLTPCILLLHKKCFFDDAPKDYRQDDIYGQISEEKVMDRIQLCLVLKAPHHEVLPATQPPCTADIHPFLSSPSGNKTKRRREDGIPEDRGSFVTTPTAELSPQEETLLGNFLDWSLDSSCSGYEGDQESEGERQGDVSGPSGVVDMSLFDAHHHYCTDSSDEDTSAILHPPHSKTDSITTDSRPGAEHSSGYSSVSSAGSPTSFLTGLPFTRTPGQSRDKLTPISHAAYKPVRRQVKRKNEAQHSEENLSDPM
uniref:Cyclin-F n=1 Tax=Leptobrachium leishanense TaxID=445787 RepID=A0A8C5R6W0_9ANUR